MTLSIPGSSSKVTLLPKDARSLAGGLPPAAPGTLFVLGVNGGMSVAPDAGFRVVFGRNDPAVHVCVGADDPHVSREHGYITYERSGWVVDNVGRMPICFPGPRLLLSGHREHLPVAYTPLFIVGPRREHLLEVRVAGRASTNPASAYELNTIDPDAHSLSPVEKLVLVCLSQRYLRSDPQPQPLTWGQVASELAEVRPTEEWGVRRLGHVVGKVRRRLSPITPGLLEEEVPPPVGNALNHNLITALLVSGTLTPADLALLEG
ncbi:FHA domain-containing protein [Fodinicola feengrottensis]|uniref:FHA domain-containing protein n=1 Tax=Fodinicola feengrottensis TaxID=435914 RepID=A0ABP4TYJ4_9ACTN|nr:hypothetical protein [Fodinicola feengrottensis]